jgi:UDP-N-acetylglucosamine--N-acetylmuramyl-(pentapeptide) pyrophosphoryl-undecaprenol N-acetylglucosamine transferase
MSPSPHQPWIAIACGGTGGHLFPGLAVADVFLARGCRVQVLISPKEVDQRAVKSGAGLQVAVLPAVALTRGALGEFGRGFWNSFLAARNLFRSQRPQAVLAMGGFTSAPPVLAGKLSGAKTFLHESNTIPGRANRWLAHVVDRAFVGFLETGPRLRHQHVIPTGTPVRAEFQPSDSGACRQALGLHPDKPVLLIQGGSQGAHGINILVSQALPELSRRLPELQFLHLTGPEDLAQTRAAYQEHGCKAVVLPFLTEMELALGAATAAISRAGASSLAELAAMRLPAILLPYPFARDDHQRWNARALADRGAAFLLEEKSTTPEKLLLQIEKLIRDPKLILSMREALARWHAPHAAELIADKIMALLPNGHRASAKPGPVSFNDQPMEPSPLWERAVKMEGRREKP